MLGARSSSAAWRRIVFFFLTPAEWGLILLISVAVAGLAAWHTIWVSPWISITVGICVFTVLHMGWSGRYVVALPHIAILIAGLQYVFGAWINFYWPPANPTYDVGANLPTYLGYAGPVALAIALGWLLPLPKPNTLAQSHGHIVARLPVELDVLFIVGIGALILQRVIHVSSLGFVFLLVSNLRYVSAYARMLLKISGWGWRLAVVLIAEVLFATGTTMFHDLLLWSLWTFVLWIYTFKPTAKTIVISVVLAVVMLPALQESKWFLRQGQLLDDEIQFDRDPGLADTPIARTGAWLVYLSASTWRAMTFNLDSDFVADIAVRYNQGWIINRVMTVVPEQEPYAGGSTIKDAAIAALFPRVVYEEKAVVGGREKMMRYAAMDMGESTSMNLGLAGEMYANFGYWGGIIGCGVFAGIFSLLFRFICRRAFVRPLWWSLVPFVFYAAVKAEDDVTFILNWTVKAAFLIAVVLLFCPAFRQILRLGQRVAGVKAIGQPHVA